MTPATVTERRTEQTTDKPRFPRTSADSTGAVAGSNRVVHAFEPLDLGIFDSRENVQPWQIATC